jgi:hypothetical protein
MLVGEVPELEARPGQPPAEHDVGAERLVDVLGEGPALSLSCHMRTLTG